MRFSRSAPSAAALALALALGSLAACSSDSSSDSEAAPTTTEAEASETTEAAAAPLQILVSNDDGYSAEGIDALVDGLSALDDVEVVVVAPLEQQSGTGGNETEGELETSEVETASGVDATAVDGFPSDSIRVALDEQGVEADLVVTGINEGQNLGPLVDASGTVGAARAAVARGIPALATSQGFGDEFDYDVAVPLIVAWVTEHREAILAGDQPVEVTNLNVPSCDEGELRGEVEVEADLGGDTGAALTTQDCTSTVEVDDDTLDVVAFNNGYVTWSTIPSEAA